MVSPKQTAADGYIVENGFAKMGQKQGMDTDELCFSFQLDHLGQADFRRINLDGTRHVLNIATKMSIGVVFSSTTSLMNTLQVKEQTRQAVIWR